MLMPMPFVQVKEVCSWFLLGDLRPHLALNVFRIPLRVTLHLQFGFLIPSFFHGDFFHFHVSS